MCQDDVEVFISNGSTGLEASWSLLLVVNCWHVSRTICSLQHSYNVSITALVSFLVISSILKQLVLGLTQDWFRELTLSRRGCVGVHDRLHILPRL